METNKCPHLICGMVRTEVKSPKRLNIHILRHIRKHHCQSDSVGTCLNHLDQGRNHKTPETCET